MVFRQKRSTSLDILFSNVNKSLFDLCFGDGESYINQ